MGVRILCLQPSPGQPLPFQLPLSTTLRVSPSSLILCAGCRGKSGQAYVTERAPKSGRNWTRHERKSPQAPPRHQRPRWSMQRARISSLTQGQPLQSCLVWIVVVCAVNGRCCLQGWNTRRVDRLYRSPDIRSSLFRPRAITKGTSFPI